MEPRIATLLGGSRPEFATLDRTSPSPCAQRLCPTQPAFIREDILQRANVTPAHPGTSITDHCETKQLREHAPALRMNSGAPIAQVLNDNTPRHEISQHASAAITSLTVPFSGRLSDLLLDSLQADSNRRKKQDQHSVQFALTGHDTSVIKLPKPPQYPKQTARRQRIPPLLQGLHQPPPLPPEGRLFPPITSESSTYARDVVVNVGLEESEDARWGEVEGAQIDESQENDTNIRLEHQKHQETKRKSEISLITAPIIVNQGGRASSPSAEPTFVQGNRQSKQGRKRHKWSEAETKNLLIGVNRFGIGKWKQILHCADLEFHARSPVDLKDRFRVCRPGDGLKPRNQKRRDDENKTSCDFTTRETSLLEEMSTINHHGPRGDVSVAQEPSKKHRRLSHRIGSAELAELGIQEPFAQSTRRPRREFSTNDDENLLKGFQRYGTVWHSMRDDKDLGFGTRHPTDLRDRFRIRYPETYARAGYKLKSKDEHTRKNEARYSSQLENQDCDHSSTGVTRPSIATDQGYCHKSKAAVTSVPSATVTKPSSMSAPMNRSHVVGVPLVDLISTSLVEPIDLIWEDDIDDESQIILNRNILQWADANPSYSTTSTPTLFTAPSTNSLNGDLFSSISGHDGSHMSPMAALPHPGAMLPGNRLSPAAVISSPLPAIGPVKDFTPDNPVTCILNAPNRAKNISLATTIAKSAVGTLSKASSEALLRTPNLPTIVFPRVPVASARSAVHSLPPPANLLSRLNVDRPEW